MENYFRKAIIGVISIGILSVIGMFGSYLFRLTLARNLSPTEFGLFYAVLSLVISIHMFRDPGLKSALIKFIAEWNVKKETVRINEVISLAFLLWSTIAIIFSTLIILFAKFLSEVYFKTPESFWLIIIISIAYLFVADSVVLYVLQGFQRMILFASFDAIRSALLFFIAIGGFVFFKSNVFIPAIAWLLAPIIVTLIFLPIIKIFVFKKFKLVTTFEKGLLKKMVIFGLPVTISTITYSLFQQMGTLVLTYIGSLEEVGLLNIALPTASLIANLAASIWFVVFPLSAELWAKGFIAHLKEGINLLYRYSFMTILPISITMAAFSKIIITILFGEKYIGASQSLAILAIGTMFWVITSINFNFLAGIGKSKEPMKIMTFIFCLSFILSLVLARNYGLLGVVWALFVGYFLSMILSLRILGKTIEIKISPLFWVKNLISSGTFLSCIILLKEIVEMKNVYFESTLICVVSSLVYVGLLFLLRLTTLEELRGFFIRIIKKNQ